MSSQLAEFDELKWTHSVKRLDKPSSYLLRKARRNPHGLEDLRKSLVSSTIYVGNLSFYTSEEQIYELFSKCGMIKRIIMGLDRFKFTPCGFCFIIYNEPREALNAVKYLSDTKLDEKNISIDLDPGFEDGRQFGRGKSGGQVSDELKFEYDAARGGFAIPLAQRIAPRFGNGGGNGNGRRRGGRRQQHQQHDQQYDQQYDQYQPEQEDNYHSQFDNYVPEDAMGTFQSRYAGAETLDAVPAEAPASEAAAPAAREEEEDSYMPE
ncbi:nuclear cap-binding protein subunit [Maudiozyma humilis]|uniref:Nuclear cap-binding protein subunit 2 n=1 Tax=Maudiozyma humilis TaxID=51915 RepID=A0AAV5RVE3_MAUHU|nr:hypothetical protein DAKH74_011150 [Kazachstania humilis]GMM55131.1 nuclear cap-binding protein subunit [Kazachstania humilis]